MPATNSTTESVSLLQPRVRGWVVTSIVTSERSGLLVCGTNLLDSTYADKSFSWNLRANEFAASVARTESEWDLSYATIGDDRAARLCAHYGINLPRAVAA